jgi:hypothetical protein
MARIFGFVVGAIWLSFAFMAFRSSSAGWSSGYPVLGFWWAVITGLFTIAATVAIVGTARHRTTGPKK